MTRNKNSNSGFTLIEFMVTLAIGVILMMVAIPSLTTYKRNAELTSFTNSLVASMNAARGEAMKRGRYAMVVPTDGKNWSNGWVVFVDMDRSQNYSTASDITILNREVAPSYLTITGTNSVAGSSPYIMFDASGYSQNKGGGLKNSSFSIARNDVSGSTALAETRLLLISRIGRVRTCRPSTDTTCISTSDNP